MVAILYVEDSETIADTYQTILNRRNHKVKWAFNGQEGLEFLATGETVDIIFCDFNMPVMNGGEFCRTVKENSRYQNYCNLPIVGVGDFPKSEQNYLVEHLPKPFQPEDILRCIGQYCRKK